MFEMVDPLPGALRLKMPRFVTAWTIVDLVMCSLRTLELPFIVAALFLLGRCEAPQNELCITGCRLILWLEFSSVLAIALTGLTGNIAMLCRRHWAQYFCFFCALLTLVNFGIMVWQTLICFKGSPTLTFSIAVIAVTLVIMLRTALLVFNLLSLVRARLFFKERDGY